MKHAKCYVKDYPRPQFVRPTYQMLNGYWDFCFDDDDRGEKEGWFKRFPKQQVIKVPFTYQTPKSGIHTTTHHPIVWYHRTIRLSPEQLNEKRLLLHFEGCDYYTKMYVNGSFIGNHYGGYTRFTFDLTKVIQPGENTITVRVEDDYGCTKPRGKQRWKDESYYCCYIDTTGIWKSVWLEFVPEWYLKGIKMTPHIEQYTVDIEYTLNAFKKGLKLQTIIFFKDVEVANVTVELKRPFFRQAIDIMSETHHSKINLWNHHEPNLYDVEFRLYDNDQLIDCVGSYFGIRHIGIENSWLTINYTPSYLKMVLDQGYWKDSHLTPPSEEALLLDIERALAMGFNGIRMHQKIEDERFYYYCDILGIYVWLEMPSFYEFNDEAVYRFTREWMEVIQQHYNHPSIITWVPFNESWGIPNVPINRKQQHFTKSIYYLTKTMDQSRPVITNDGWQHTISDIITLHDYKEYGEALLSCYRPIEELLNHQKTKGLPPRLPFASNYRYHGQPIMLTEYGGIAFEKNKDEGWGYGQMVKDEQDFIQRLKSLTDAIQSLPFCSGYCVTQLTDVQQEMNGLLDEDRNPKVPLEAIRAINEGI